MMQIFKRFTLFTLCILSLSCASLVSAQTELKIGVIDIDRVFNEYYKTKAAEERINEAREAEKKEIDTRWAGRVPMLETLAGLERDLDNKSLAGAARADKVKRRDDKIAELQALERECEQINYTREMAIREQAGRSRAAIVEDIMKVVNERVKADGYDMVLDKSGATVSGVRGLLASRPDMEFTQDIILALNQSQPPPGAAPAASPKPAAKKPTAPPKK